MFQIGERVEVEILSTGFEGKSVAKKNDFVIFIDGAVEDDIVEVEIFKKKKNYAEAKIIKVIKSSDKRTTPQCNYFGICGGCKYQNIDYNEQLKFKKDHVSEALKHIGILNDVNVLETIKSDEIYYYRNKMEYSFGLERWLTNEEIQNEINRNGFFLGFHAPKKYNRIVDINECFLQSQISNKILNFTRDFAVKNNLTIYNSEIRNGYLRNLVIRQSKNTSDLMVNIVTFEDLPVLMQKYSDEIRNEIPEITTIVNNINTKPAQIAVGEFENIYFGNGKIKEVILGVEFEISANSFFQTNTLQAEKLFSIVNDFADFKNEDVVLDLYCGAGSISLVIASKVKQVIGIELNPSAISDANENMKLNKIANCEFIVSDLNKFLLDEKLSNINFDCIIVDPPRNGLHPKVIDELGKINCKKIIYVSCNPATLARDVKALSNKNYSVQKIQPVDMFPHTYHIEAVALLIKN